MNKVVHNCKHNSLGKIEQVSPLHVDVYMYMRVHNLDNLNDLSCALMKITHWGNGCGVNCRQVLKSCRICSGSLNPR